jgi:hypothetical protein
MDVIFSNQAMTIRKKPSIFLAGPTARPLSTLEQWHIWFYGLKLRWRQEALQIFTHKKFTGTVIVPEHDDWGLINDYIGQTEWEANGLGNADVILFWVPRHLRFLPAFTTNIEFGKYFGPRIVYGRPPTAPKNRYLDWMYQTQLNKVPCTTLDQTIEEALKMLG